MTLGPALMYVEEGYAAVVQRDWQTLTVRISRAAALCSLHSGSDSCPSSSAQR